jgi:hypothetical protein
MQRNSGIRQVGAKFRKGAESTNIGIGRQISEFRKGAKSTNSEWTEIPQRCGNYGTPQRCKPYEIPQRRGQYEFQKNYEIPEFGPKKGLTKVGRDSENLREDLFGRIRSYKSLVQQSIGIMVARCREEFWLRVETGRKRRSNDVRHKHPFIVQRV